MFFTGDIRKDDILISAIAKGPRNPPPPEHAERVGTNERLLFSLDLGGRSCLCGNKYMCAYFLCGIQHVRATQCMILWRSFDMRLPLWILRGLLYSETHCRFTLGKPTSLASRVWAAWQWHTFRCAGTRVSLQLWLIRMKAAVSRVICHCNMCSHS